MKSAYSFLLIFICYGAFAQDCDCDYFIESETTYFIGESVLPGQTICVEGGDRAGIKLKDINGTADNPIRIINCGGVVTFNEPYSVQAVTIDRSSHFKFSGTGDDSEEFGFNIEYAIGYGILVRNLSTNFEIDHVLIDESRLTGIIIRDNPTCDLVYNEGSFELESVYIHDVTIQNCKEGISIGHPNFRTGVFHPYCGNLYPYAISDVRIERCNIQQIGSGNGLSLYGCEGVVQDNIFDDIQGTGVLMKNECHLTFERNLVKNTSIYGVQVLGGGEHNFYSNLFIDNGVEGTGAVWVAFKTSLLLPAENNLQFLHNTVVNSGHYNLGIANAGSASAICNIKNNIFCEPNSIGPEIYEYAPYFSAAFSLLIQFDNNIMSDSKYDLGFVNPDEDDFQIDQSSEAINYGVSSELSEDYIHQIRNLAGAPDAGAFEYVPEPLAYFEHIDLVGLYVDDFKNILGDEIAETALLEYAQSNGFNYLLLYNLSYIHTHGYDLTDPEEAITLANFIERAKKDYGMAQVGAVGEKDASFDKIEEFNSLFGDEWFQKIDVLNLEFEFWTDPGSAVFEYYCENYLSPNGYPCTNAGAFDFYSDQIAAIDERAHAMGIISEIYLGYITDDEASTLGELTDRILLHYYRTTDVYGDGKSIYNYHPNRIRGIAQSERKPAIMPIFSSRAYHMGPWLLTHSLHQPMDTWLNGESGYYEDETEGVGELNIAGFQWYRFTSFLDLFDEDYAPEEGTNLNDANPDEIIINYNQATHDLIINHNVDSEEGLKLCCLYSMTGDLVWSTEYSSTSEVFSLANLPAGVYLTYVKSENGIGTSQKIVLL